MDNWYDVYLNQISKYGGNKNYIIFKLKHKKKLLKILRKNINGGKVVEVGCGTGIICSKLSHEGYNVSGIDINKDILKLASNLEKEFYGKNKVVFEKKSMFELDYPPKEFDLCYSVGVLEHFSDEQIVDSLSQQIKISRKVILVIPTKWFDDNETLHGDDRFLKLSNWRDLILKSNGKIIKEYSYPFRNNNYSCIKYLKKIFRPKAYRIFLIEESR